MPDDAAMVYTVLSFEDANRECTAATDSCVQISQGDETAYLIQQLAVRKTEELR